MAPYAINVHNYSSKRILCIVPLAASNLTSTDKLPDPFRNMVHVVVNFTVQFKRTGYREIEPLETSLSGGMLGSTPVKLIAIESNDGKSVFSKGSI